MRRVVTAALPSGKMARLYNSAPSAGNNPAMVPVYISARRFSLKAPPCPMQKAAASCISPSEASTRSAIKPELFFRQFLF